VSVAALWRKTALVNDGSQRAAAFFDEAGDREWARFEEGGRNTRASLEVHLHYLHRFVHAGDKVLDAGAGPGRFTIELARIGAEVSVVDVSTRQLELNRERVAAEGLEDYVTERITADITDLSRFADGMFDAVVCFGGPISYVTDRREDAVSELVRVTRSGGHVLVSVMSLVGALTHYLDIALDLVRRDGSEPMEEIVRTGFLPEKPDYGHLDLHLFRWRELEQLLSQHGEVVAASAAGLLKPSAPLEPDLQPLLTRIELDLGDYRDPIDGGEHMIAVLSIS
jgi:ubiquinone/menaquinone biosynthesis C-methylase UbiE